MPGISSPPRLTMTRPAIKIRMGLIEWATLVFLGALWGSSFPFNTIALRELPHFSLVGLRLIFATVLLAGVSRALGHTMPTGWRIWRGFAVMGLLNNFLPFNLTTYGQTHIPGGLAAVLVATAPLFTVVIAHYFTRDEPMSARKVAGVVAGIAGVAVIVGIDALHGGGAQVAGQVAVVMASVAMASAGVFGRSLRDVPPLISAAGQAACSMGLMLPIALVVDRPWELSMPGPATWGAVAGLAIIGSAISYVLYFRLLARVGANNVMLVNLLIPVSALILGAVFLGEAVAPRHLAGMLLIALGLAISDGRALAWLRLRAAGA